MRDTKNRENIVIQGRVGHIHTKMYTDCYPTNYTERPTNYTEKPTNYTEAIKNYAVTEALVGGKKSVKIYKDI